MKAVLLRVGKGRTRWADTAVEDYARRFRQRLPLEEVVLKPATHRGDVEATRTERIEGAQHKLDP